MAKERKPSLTPDINLLYEIGTLRYTERQWKRFNNPDTANLAEHSFRVAWSAALIAEREGADVAHSMMIALVHEIGESRTNDADYLSQLYTTRNERQGVRDILLGTTLHDFVELWEEYETQDTLEAKVVKDADKLDIDFEIKEQEARGHKYHKLWRAHRKGISEKFHTETAKQMWDALQKSSPNNWFADAYAKKLS